MITEVLLAALSLILFYMARSFKQSRDRLQAAYDDLKGQSAGRVENLLNIAADGQVKAARREPAEAPVLAHAAGPDTPDSVQEPVVEATTAEQQVIERTAELLAATRRLEREVLERQRAEIALRRSEEQLRTAFDAMRDWIHVVDPDLRIVLVNETFRRVTREFGLASNPVGRTPLELFPFLPDQVQAEYRQVFETGQPLVTLESTQAGSVEMITETSKIPIVEDGQVTRVITLIRDITESKQVENALRASESRLRHFIEQSLDGVCITDENWIIVEWNRAGEQITGLKREEVLGHPLWEVIFRLIPPEELAAGRHQNLRTEILARTTETDGLPLQHLGEYLIRRPDGTSRILQNSVFPLKTDGKKMSATLMRDVTERKNAEETLRIAEARNQAMLNAVPDLMFRVDHEGRFLDYYAPHVEELLFTPEQFMGRTVMEVLPLDVARPVMAGVEQVLQTGQVQQVRYSVLVQGQIRYSEARIAASGGNEALVIVRNITDLVQAEERIVQLALEKERSAILAGFIQDVSHEFGNPLSVIKNDLYLIAHLTEPDRRQRRLENIGGQIFHIERLVKGLLTMTHLDHDLVIERQPLDLNPLVSTLHDGLSSVAQEKEHTFLLNLASDLLPICADQRYLYQALSELVRNAILFTPPGGTVTLRTLRQENEVMVEVIDTGIGIDTDDLTHIFDRFFRVDKARAERGAGLGLSIAQRIVELHQGRIEVESTLGAGSCFRVVLPIQSC